MSETQKKLPRFVPGDVMGRICVLWRVIFGVLKRRGTYMRACVVLIYDVGARPRSFSLVFEKGLFCWECLIFCSFSIPSVNNLMKILLSYTFYHLIIIVLYEILLIFNCPIFVLSVQM